MCDACLGAGRAGRHLADLDAWTGQETLRFERDERGQLIAIIDRDGLRTTIERDAQGEPVAIIGPFGHRNTLELDDQGMIKRLGYPDGTGWAFEYASGGLLTQVTNPRGFSSTMSYDDEGELLKDTDAAGGFKALSVLDDGVKLETAMGRAVSYERTRNAGEVTRKTTGPDGLSVVGTRALDETAQVSFPDGSIARTTCGPDPRFGFLAPFVSQRELETPSGRTLRSALTQQVELADARDLLSVTTTT